MNKMMNKMKKMDVQFTLMLVLLLLVLYFIYITFNLSEAFESSCSELPNKLKQDDKQLVLFYADWCGHCKKIKPEWDEAATEVGDEKMIKVNLGDGTEEQKKTMTDYGIQGFPTIVKFENGSPNGQFESRDKSSFLDFFS
tara:strand:- start:285 stop:704 length:420 start_codon:yes stop_codon:yes gene_type:complete